jgi:hypothetical protein
LTLAGIVTAAAISITSKSNPETLRRLYNYDKKTEITIPLPENYTLESNIRNIESYHAYVSRKNKENFMSTIDDYKTLETLTWEAKKILSFPTVYIGTRQDSIANNRIDSLVNVAINRPKRNEEALVGIILDNVTGYTEVVDKYFIKASIREESGYNTTIESHAGAKGLMQFMRPTWKHFGEGPYIPTVYDPEKNIEAGIRYYTWMEELFSEAHPNWDELTVTKKRNLLAAGYNGGHNRLKGRKVHWDITKMPQETRKHVEKIDKAMVELQSEDLYLQIAYYRERVKEHESKLYNPFWLAMNTSP